MDPVAQQKLGIEDVKPLLAVAIQAGNVADKMGHVDGLPAKVGTLVVLVPDLMALPGVHFDKVLPELKDLDEAEKTELLAFVKEKFDIVDDKLEAVIEGGLGLLIKAQALVSEAIALAKTLKA